VGAMTTWRSRHKTKRGKYRQLCQLQTRQGGKRGKSKGGNETEGKGLIQDLIKIKTFN